MDLQAMKNIWPRLQRSLDSIWALRRRTPTLASAQREDEPAENAGTEATGTTAADVAAKWGRRTRTPPAADQGQSDDEDGAEDNLLAREDPDYGEEGYAAINLATDESAGTSNRTKVASGKRSRLSRRDQRLGQSLADNRMQVAERSAELRELAAKDDTQGQKELLEMQTEVEERIARDDRVVQRDIVQVHRNAIEMQRDNKKSVDVTQMTRLYVADGMKPAEARKLALKDVIGDDV
jgi:hypothetical protein